MLHLEFRIIIKIPSHLGEEYTCLFLLPSTSCHGPPQGPFKVVQKLHHVDGSNFYLNASCQWLIKKARTISLPTMRFSFGHGPMGKAKRCYRIFVIPTYQIQRASSGPGSGSSPNDTSAPFSSFVHRSTTSAD